MCAMERPYNRRRLPGKRTSAAGVKKHWPRSGITRDPKGSLVYSGVREGARPPRGGRRSPEP
ncbi:hypothetical protein ACFPRL_36435 [Pseudoclavibacter helvolus]